MNNEALWTGEGKLFRELSLIQQDETFIGQFRKGVYTPDENVTLTSSTIEEAIEEVKRYDDDYHELATLSLEEG